jgi:hypothetical protein
MVASFFGEPERWGAKHFICAFKSFKIRVERDREMRKYPWWCGL